MNLAELLQNWKFIAVAVGFGAFFGAYGASMVVAARPPRPPIVSARIRVFADLELIFQFWFNFVGGFVGWAAVAFLWNRPFDQYDWKDLAAVVIAFIGITGHLPHLSTGVRDALVGLTKKVGG